jgi:REP-associated tyrosine transposase
LQGQVLLGDDAFVERLEPSLRDRRRLKEIPRAQRFASRPALAKIFSANVMDNRRRRNRLICEAHVAHCYSLSEIGRAVDLHYSTVSRIVNREQAGDKNAQNKI